ncbi:MAG: tetratricopeptide repeat protein, partial [Muribaculaceae bacterium]|nr:tetratricopeptide repeat protein [Muribaculaceae bacterium]
ISPIGSFRITDIQEQIKKEGIDSFAKDFFIWNNPEKDARYHRGLALHAMWEDCYFMPSHRSKKDSEINDYIIKELEQAALLDPSLPFPKNEYEILCRLHGHTPISTDGIPIYKTEFKIGYRREIVSYKIGNIRFKLPGNYLTTYEDGTVIYYDNEIKNWHTVRCTAFSIKGEATYLEDKDPIVEEGEFDGGRYRIYDAGMEQDSEDKKPYPVYGCHILSPNQFTLITICAATKRDLNKLAEVVLSSLSSEKPVKKQIYHKDSIDQEFKNQIEEWHNSDRHNDIIRALESIPETERNFEIVGLLARAYNNIEAYIKAIDLLESVRKEGEEDALWNYRLGYSLYYMDDLTEALKYFSKAKELNPEDEDTVFFIRQCNMELPLSKRVERFWNWFEENEQKLSEMINPVTQEDSEKLIAFVQEGTSLISEKLDFNLGGDYEFSFSVEGWPDLFLINSYIISNMPESLRGKWKFFPFNQGDKGNYDFTMYGADISSDQVMVKASYLEERNTFLISYYEEHLCALQKNESDGAMWIILENILGEGVSYNYINEIEAVARLEDGMMPLSGLKKYIENTVKHYQHKFFENPKDTYSTYQLTPQESDELRFDVIIGSTCLMPIVSDYYNDSTNIFDHANNFGAQALYIAFPNGDDIDGKEILHLRHEIEDRISGEIIKPMNLGQVIGGATGTANSYIDLIVFDLYAFIEMVKPLLKQYPSISFYLSDFRRHAELTQLSEGNSKK